MAQSPSLWLRNLQDWLKSSCACLGAIAKRLNLALWSQEKCVLGDRHRDILIVQGQPVASGRLALSCCDNRITSLTSRQRQQRAFSSYWSHLSLQPRSHKCFSSSGGQERGELVWYCREGEGMWGLLPGLLLKSPMALLSAGPA
ncbi:hypothetical protein mRhiFer1_010098 [Rhinolophus ferrumequinum]|uniref:Uncharacterized protein n=1 Tax=Rhinolophus ferrumequinum TaxID=59479 RepID=A0A7J7XPE3_RHIFE|nr:hypothetical protein mRhiFer1_010098 [Rhinolophus ferrumequinum]